MQVMPTGTVTFLFTDIVGSTKLWELNPAGMKSAVAKHDAILSHAVASHNGFIVKKTGDGFHAVFETAVMAVAAALFAQQRLCSDSWEEIASNTLRVRMGLHSGEAEYRAEDYYGSALNRAARLMSVAWGGQILLSSATAELAQDGLPPVARLLSLGEHRLKDLGRPEHIYQLVHPSLPADFPPLQSIDQVPNNLPEQLTSFIGRERELAEIHGFLHTNRLVTLTGPGGTGKTRLAQEAGALEFANFRHGIWLVELAPLSAPSQIIPAIGQTFGLQEVMFEPFHTLVFNYLREKKILLILDNCEHLIEECANLADDLLHKCGQLTIIASSREALGIAGEVAYRIPSLNEEESTRLFIERARAVNPRLTWTEKSAASVTQICTRLDGIPLAIELAAARVKLLSPEQIAARLDDRFRLLIGGSRTALPRQQTLRALIDWSYDLLEGEEKRLLCIASVFAAGWSLEAIEAVADDPNVLDALDQLVNKSLVLATEREHEMRYSLLETIRQYAQEKLFDSGQAEQVRDRHYSYYLAFSQTAWENLRSEHIYTWLDKTDDEMDNLRAALDWGLVKHPEGNLRLAANFTMVVSWRGFLPEGKKRIESALKVFMDLPPVTGESLLQREKDRAMALWAKASIEIGLGENHAALIDSREAIALSRKTGDKFVLGNSLQAYYLASMFTGEADGPAAAKEGLAVLLDLGEPWGISSAYMNMARVALMQGDLALREEYARKGAQAGQYSPLVTAYGYLGLGMSERFIGHQDEARKHFEAGLVLFRRLKNKSMETVMLSELGHIARLTGDENRALETYRQTIQHWQELGGRAAVANQLECFAFIAVHRNQPSRAARLLGAAEALRETVDSPMTELEQAEYAAETALLRSLIPEMELMNCWAEGRAMTMDQAILFACET